MPSLLEHSNLGLRSNDEQMFSIATNITSGIFLFIFVAIKDGVFLFQIKLSRRKSPPISATTWSLMDSGAYLFNHFTPNLPIA